MNDAPLAQGTGRGGLYIHVPFCHAKCYYCDFYSLSATEELKDAYVDALLQEWESRRHELEGSPVTVYLGGGTPSSLGLRRLGRLLESLPLDEAREVTLEANPEDVSAGWARGLRSMGVNRVSMGVQSLVDAELRAVGRRHDAATALRAVKELRQGGFDNISLDLIFGLPGQTLSSWLESLDGLLSVRPEHLSAYSLTYEEGTHLTALMRRGKVSPIADEQVEAMYGALCSRAAAAGYEHYEISNFALPGRRALHNSSYWRMVPYLGIGPAAHSFDGVATRRACHPSLRRWMEAVRTGAATYEEEVETGQTLDNDRVMTALRTAEGIPASEEALAAASPFIADGRMEQTRGTDGKPRLRIAERAWLVSDPIMAEFMQV